MHILSPPEPVGLCGPAMLFNGQITGKQGSARDLSGHRGLTEMLHQSLKETFAEKLPGEIEKVKKLRKYVIGHSF